MDMAKIAVYLPGSVSEDMVRLAVAKYKHIEPLYITQLRNEELLRHASKAISEGCEFFIARGMQAVMLEQLNIPVLPLRITAQELGVLLKKIKQDIPGRSLKIGLIGFANMFCDVSHFNELCEIEIQQYLLTSIDQMSGVLQKAKDAGVDAVIGGRHCNHTALSMVGGAQDLFDECKDLLGTMGSSVVWCGEVGAGNTTKLANQIIVACNIEACHRDCKKGSTGTFS